MHNRARRMRGGWFVSLGLSGLLCAGVAWAQKDDDRKLRPPKDVELTASDKAQIAATYYQGPKTKDTVPVVLLHMWERDRTDYKDLALYLQAQGHSVLVPDLRGHGDSKKALDLKRMQPNRFPAEALKDMTGVREFLREENNAGNVNLRKLCIVGSEAGASVALLFAMNDWSRPPVVGEWPNGCYTKALVLISPEPKGVDFSEVLKHDGVRKLISVMIITGKQSKNHADAKKLHGFFERGHPDPGEGKLDKKTLFFGSIDSGAKGTSMLREKSLNLDKSIGRFIDLRLVKAEDLKAPGYQWHWIRRDPHVSEKGEP